MRPAPVFLIVALTLVSWLAAANHCALGGMAVLQAAMEKPHSCCHQDQTDGPGRTVECCEKLSAPLPMAAAAPQWHAVGVQAAWPEASWKILPSLAGEFTFVSQFSGSPPGLLSFAELVLQRSLPVHAPPVSLA